MTRYTKTVVLTGLFVGATDLLAAYISQWIKTGKYADKMLNYIGGGILGFEDSMAAGNWGALLGFICHFFIAMAATVFFFWIFPKWKFLSFNKYLIGMLYGAAYSAFIGNVVMPLTPLPHGPFSLSGSLVAWFILGIALGIPIAYNAYRYYGVKDDTFIWKPVRADHK